MATAVVFTLGDNGGFFSNFFFLCEAHLTCKRHGWTLFVDSTNWIYGRWHLFFTSLTEWNNEFEQQFETILRVSHNNLDPLGIVVQEAQGPRYLCLNRLVDYEEATKELFRLQTVLLRAIEEHMPKESYKSIFVRRGDKITSGETQDISLGHILQQTSLTPTDVVYVQSDDYSVVEQLQKTFPRIYTIVRSHERGSVHETFKTRSVHDRITHTANMLMGLEICGRASECWTDETSNVGRFLKLRYFDSCFLYSVDGAPIQQDMDALTTCPAFRDTFLADKSDMFVFPALLQGQPTYVCHKFVKSKPAVGIIMVRHMNSPTTMDYWYESYMCIRRHHPDVPVVIIDDRSATPLLQHPLTQTRERSLHNAVILHSDQEGRGEMLAYVYYNRYAFFSKAAVLHDSVFLQKPLPFEDVETIRFLWHFEHTWDDAAKEVPRVQLLENPEAYLALYEDKKNWWGCFGVMSIVTYEALVVMDLASQICIRQAFMDSIQTREDRMACERIFALVATHAFPELAVTPSLFGKIHDFYADRGIPPCSYSIQHYLDDMSRNKDDQQYPIFKVFSGR